MVEEARRAGRYGRSMNGQLSRPSMFADEYQNTVVMIFRPVK